MFPKKDKSAMGFFLQSFIRALPFVSAKKRKGKTDVFLIFYTYLLSLKISAILTLCVDIHFILFFFSSIFQNTRFVPASQTSATVL